MRHPGLQKANRIQEIARAISSASSGVQGAFYQIRQHQEKLEALKVEVDAEQRKIDTLLTLQRDVIEAQLLTEFGLPVEITKEEFERITGQRITS